MTPGCKYVVLADDPTGALEAGALYASCGISSAVTISESPPATVAAEAVVVDMEARHADSERASSIVATLIADARSSGISSIYLKVDSTLRGSIPAQITGALAGWPGRSVVFAPAYPRMGRTVRADLLYVNSRLLTDTAFACDPMDPARTSSVSEKLRTGGCGPVIHVSDARKLRDVLAVAGSSVFILDTETAEQMRQIARVVVDAGWPCICAGSAGFLAELIAAGSEVYSKTGLIVNGSLNSTSLKQCEIAGSDVQVFTVDCDDGEQTFSSRVVDTIRAEGWAVLSTSVHGSNPGCVLERLANITAAVVRDAQCESLTIFGGDTAAKILSTLGVHVIHPIRELLPGIPVSRISVQGRPLKLVTKAGGFGESDVIRRLRTALRPPE